MVSYIGELEGIIRSLDKILSEEGGGRFPRTTMNIGVEGTSVKPCPHGSGVFATKDFKPGELISSFKQPFLDTIEPDKAWATLRIGDKWWREPEQGEPDYWANFLDHADNPNAQFTNFDFGAGTGDLITTQPIKAGEEIFINYGSYAPENIEDVRDDLEQLIQSTEGVAGTSVPETEPEERYSWTIEKPKEEGRWDDKEPDDEEPSGILDNKPPEYVSDRPIPTEADLIPTEDPTMPSEGREPEPEPDTKAKDQMVVLKECIDEFIELAKSKEDLKEKEKTWNDKVMTLTTENYKELIDAMQSWSQKQFSPTGGE